MDYADARYQFEAAIEGTIFDARENGLSDQEIAQILKDQAHDVTND